MVAFMEGNCVEVVFILGVGGEGVMFSYPSRKTVQAKKMPLLLKFQRNKQAYVEGDIECVDFVVFWVPTGH